MEREKLWLGQQLRQQEQKEWPQDAPQYRGVNLGGWLVLESWMYPDWWHMTGVPLWKGEFQFNEILKDKALPLLRAHWDQWVTRDELVRLKDAGITYLRIPIGYWILGKEWLLPGDTYQPGGWPYLERALGWASELGLKCIIDLHGAPGAQNGNDNSGFSGGNTAINWTQPSNLARTTDVLVYLAQNLTKLNASKEMEGSIAGLCLLNEPWTTAVGGPVQLDTLKSWLQTTTDAVLATGWKGDVWFPDGFALDWDGWRDFLTPPEYPRNIFADAHIYMMFDDAVADLDAAGQAQNFCREDNHYRQQLERAGGVGSGVVVGEYSMDFRKWPTSFPYSNETLTGLQDLLLVQQHLYNVIGDKRENAAVGGFFWSFKSLGRVDIQTFDQSDLAVDNSFNNLHSPWSYLSLLTDGVASPNLAKATPPC
ncbi:glucan-beta-glucosidase [Nannochloropsis oceanica]